MRTNNPIVANAILNAMGINWSQFRDFSEGDTVEATRAEVHRKGVAGKVLKVTPDALTVRWSDDGFTATYGKTGNFRNLTPPKPPSNDERIDEELKKSGYGRSRETAREWLTSHRRGLMSKYGREAYLRACDRWIRP